MEKGSKMILNLNDSCEKYLLMKIQIVEANKMVEQSITSLRELK